MLLLTAATVVLWTAAVAMSYRDARRELDALFDAQLAETAEVLLRQSAHEREESRDRPEAARGHRLEHPYAQELHFQVWHHGGRLAYQSSPDLPREPLVAGLANGYADRTLHGVGWRVAVLTDPETGRQIQLCQRLDARERVAAAIARKLFLPLAAAVPLLAALVWLGTSSGLRPLARFAGALGGRTHEDLRAVDGARLPSELVPVAGALNGLLDRLRARLDLERRFTADAAHELRTPLAALKTQAEVALGARSDGERTRAISLVVRGTERMTHLVEQLLTLARLDPEMSEAAERFDLAGVVRESAGMLAGAALERGVTLEVDAREGSTMAGNRSLIATLVRNLVENAILYSRRGDHVRAEVGHDGSDVTLRVTDSGPGMPKEERARAFDRFYRGTGAHERGSGLGLSIVTRIADLHGAAVALDEAPGGGLEVVARFPAGGPSGPPAPAASRRADSSE